MTHFNVQHKVLLHSQKILKIPISTGREANELMWQDYGNYIGKYASESNIYFPLDFFPLNNSAPDLFSLDNFSTGLCPPCHGRYHALPSWTIFPSRHSSLIILCKAFVTFVNASKLREGNISFTVLVKFY